MYTGSGCAARNDAGTHASVLRTAHEMFAANGISGVRGTLRTGTAGHGWHYPPPDRRPTKSRRLTAQEAQIARMARDGLSNADIGSRLFISPRTVEYHLHKVYGKLGISSRAALSRIPLT